ncbi:hypothetical protein ACFLUZ_05925 [Chloroflexota bacterium]
MANEVMSKVPGFHFTLTQHLKENEDDPTDFITTQTIGDGKVGGDLLQYATMTMQVGPPDGITIETRIISGQAFNLNPVTKLWDFVPGTPYPSQDPVVKLLSGQLNLKDIQMTTEYENGVPIYRLNGTPEPDLDISSFTLWVDANKYLVRKIETIQSLSDYPLLPSGTSVVVYEQWQFQPLKEAFSVLLPEGVTLQPTPSPIDVISTPFGEMLLYRGERIPVSIQYPATWLVTPDSSPPSYPRTMRHNSGTPSQLTITEPTFEEIGSSDVSLDAWADIVIATNQSFVPDFTLISQKYINFSDSEKAKVIVFSAESGKRMFYRLIYVYKNGLSFNLTYAYRPEIEDIESLIDYSFSTLQLDN